MAMVIVDDTSPLINYNGQWNLDTTNQQDAKGNYGPVYDTTQHWTAGNNSLTFSFQGSFIAIVGSNNPQSAWGCSVDGAAIDLSPFQFWENNWWLCSSSNLQDGSHTVTVNAIVANGQMFWVDRIMYTPSPSVTLSNQALFIDNLDPQIQYGPGWDPQANGAITIASAAGTKLTMTFQGTSVRWFGDIFNTGKPTSTASYSVDGGASTTFTIGTQPTSVSSLFNQEYFSTPDFPPGLHTLVVQYLGESGSAGLVLDYLEVRGGAIPQSSGNVGPVASGGIPPSGSALSSSGSASGSASTTGAVQQSTISSTVQTQSSGSTPHSGSGSASNTPISASPGGDTGSGSGVPSVNGTGSSRSQPIGAIVGGVIGGLALILAAVLILIFMRSRRRTVKASQVDMDNQPDYDYFPTSNNITSRGAGPIVMRAVHAQIPPSKFRSSMHIGQPTVNVNPSARPTGHNRAGTLETISTDPATQILAYDLPIAVHTDSGIRITNSPPNTVTSTPPRILEVPPSYTAG